MNIDNKDFWLAFDKMLNEHELIIDRLKGSCHPKYKDFIYPLNYGYLKDTTSMDGGGIDVWQGSSKTGFDAIVVTVDLLKKDSEVKLLINCNEQEKTTIYDFHNESEYMKAILIKRN